MLSVSQLRSEMRVFLRTLHLRTLNLAAAALADIGDEVASRGVMDEEPPQQQLRSRMMGYLCDVFVRTMEEAFDNPCPNSVFGASRSSDVSE